MTSTQKWIIGILVLISMGVSGFVIGQLKEVNLDLQNYKMTAAKESLGLAKDQVGMMKEYVLKEDYKCAMDDLKKQLGKMDDKLDNLIKEIRRK